MKGVIEVCKPREDIIKGDVSDEIYAAHLGQVRDERAPSVYTDPNTFFRNTYPTDGLKTTIREVFSRLPGSSKSGSPLIKLETSLGGGKSGWPEPKEMMPSPRTPMNMAAESFRSSLMVFPSMKKKLFCDYKPVNPNESQV